MRVQKQRQQRGSSRRVFLLSLVTTARSLAPRVITRIDLVTTSIYIATRRCLVGARAKNPRTPPSVPERRERERERGDRTDDRRTTWTRIRQAFLAQLDDRSWIIAARSRILSLHFVTRRCEARSEKASWRNDNVDARGANLIPMLSNRYTCCCFSVRGTTRRRGNSIEDSSRGKRGRSSRASLKLKLRAQHPAISERIALARTITRKLPGRWLGKSPPDTVDGANR